MSLLQLGRRSSLLREPLDCRPSVADALRCLHDTERPFALVGAWAGGGVILGCSPVRVALESEDPFALIAESTRGEEDAEGEPEPPGVGGGWVGYLGYPLRALVEDGHPSPPRKAPLPAFALAYYDHVVRRDAGGEWWFEALTSPERAAELEDRHRWWVERLADPPPRRAVRTNGWQLEPTLEGHEAVVAACRARIHAGDLFQANICGELSGEVVGAPLELLIEGVESLAPDRAAYLEGPWGAIVSLSPELFLERRGRRVRTAPIKGTRPRGNDPSQAAAQRAELSRSAKDRAENVMIVDLMRNDLGRVCEPGTINVISLAEARSHTGVWHLVSEIGGRLRSDVDDAQLLRATFPPGSVTGAPKIAAMNVIAELESTGRQSYTGAIGIASPYLGLELNVAIRTFELSDGGIRLGVGGGVVADSDPRAEARELAVKASPLLAALDASLPKRERRGRAVPVRRLGPIPVPRPDPRRGVFETVRVNDGRPHALELHLERLRSSVDVLYGARLPDSVAAQIEAAARGAPDRGRLRIDVRPTGSGDLDLNLEVGALPPLGGVELRSWTVPGGLGPHKWSDRRLIDAIEGHCVDQLPLLVDADGLVLEASRATVFALGEDGIVRTPPDDGRILPGVARGRVLAAAAALGVDVVEEPLELDDLRHARAVVLTSALRYTHADAIDGRALREEGDLLGLIGVALDN